MIILSEEEERWVEDFSSGPFRRKLLPYDECPNCGKFEYTTWKKNLLGEVTFEAPEDATFWQRLMYPFTTEKVVGYEKLEFCENCKYLKNRRRVPKDGLEEEFLSNFNKKTGAGENQ